LPGSAADLDAAYVNVAGDTMTGALTITRGTGLGFYLQGKENAPSLAPTDAYAIFMSANGGYGALSIGGRAASPYSAWLQSHNSGGTVLPLEINPVAGDLMLGSAGGSYSVKMLSDTASTSPTTGALTVAGGVGIGGAANISGQINAGSAPAGATPDGVLIGGPLASNQSLGFFKSGVKWWSFGMAANDGTLRITPDALPGVGTDALRITQGSNNIAIPSTTASTSPTTGALTVAGGVGVGGAVNIGSGSLTLTGYAGTANAGALFFGTGSAHYLYYDATNFNLAGMPLKISDTTASTSPTTGALTVAGGVGIGGSAFILSSVTVQAAGTGDPYVLFTNSAGALVSYTFWDHAAGQHKLYAGAGLFVFDQAGQAYKAGGGAWGSTSDARIKNDLGDYPRGLAEIVSLRPVTYTYKGNDTPVAPAHAKGDENSKLPLTVPYPNSDHAGAAKAEKKFAGLIAQEVEVIFPEMVSRRSAFIDGVAVDDLRDLDTTPLIFALINSCKELKARVEVLEAQVNAVR
jgi:hypothetical protein